MNARTHTCRGMTIMKIFFSLSDRMYLTKAQPVPISASVMNRRAPLSLESKAFQNVKLEKHKIDSRIILNFLSWRNWTYKCVI